MKQFSNATIEEGKLRRAQDCARLRWHHGLGTSIALVLIFSLVMNYIVPSRLPYVEAATYTFLQTSWAGGADATATSTHTSDRTGWTKYESASSSIATSTDLTIAADQSTSTTETNDTHFGGGTTASTTIIGTGATARVDLATTSSAYSLTGGSWTYRRQITFDNGSSTEDLTNFPVLVNLTSSTVNFSNFKATGTDIRFTDSDGSTELSYEIENWASSTTGANVWVKVPTVTGTSTNDSIYVYYGNASAADAQNATSVWSNNYEAVWHLNDTPTGSNSDIRDSTVNAHHGTSTGSMDSTDQNSGRVGGALTFDGGTTQGINVSDHNNWDTGTNPFTWEGWVSTTDTVFTIMSHIQSENLPLTKLHYGESGANRLETYYHNGVAAAILTIKDSATTVNDGTWRHVAWVRDGSLYTLYLDGQVLATSTDAGEDFKTINGYFRLARNAANGGTNPAPLAGSLDEVRVSASGTARTASWIRAQYKSMSNTFNTLGSETQPASNYATSGTFTSGVIDTGGNTAFGNITWNASTTTNTSSTVRVRTGNQSNLSDATAWASCNYVASSSDISGNNCVTDTHRYIQYQVGFSTTDNVSSTQFHDLTLNWTQRATTEQTLTFSPFNTENSASAITKISWTETLPAGTDVKFQIRTAPNSSGNPGTWSAWSGPTDSTNYYTDPAGGETIVSTMRDGSNDQWTQIKVFMTATVSSTPTLSDVTLTYAVNNTPQFDSNYGTNGVTVEQLATSSEDGWGSVRVIFSARDTDASSGTGSTTVMIEYSLDGGATWASTTNAALNPGATSSKAMSETVYSATTTVISSTSTNASWNAKSQVTTYTTTARIRITLNDGDTINYVTSTTSGNFTLDTTNPTSTKFTLDSSSSTDAMNVNFTDNTNIQYRFSSTSIATSSDAVAWTSAGATSLAASSTISGGLGGNASSGEVVYFQVRDAFGNYTTGTAVAPGITGDNQTRITIKDTSNPTIANYREFISWRAYVATSGATFAAYDLYRSTTTNDNYTLLATITDSATNYYTDDAVVNGTTYYYKVRFRDTDGDVSAFSAEATDAPDGQGGTDVVQPTITSIATSTVQTTWATITWTTDELASSAVRVGTSAGSYNTTSTLSNVYKTSHSETVSGLASGTLYYFQVRSTDSSGNEKTDSNGSSDYTLQTLVGPTISGIAIKSVQDATATIRWSTDVAATSAIKYSINSNLSSPTSLTSSSQVSGERELNISGLSGSTMYYFEVRSTASSGAVETIENNRGDYYSFRTTQDVTPPVISDIAVPLKTTASATITWSTNEPATSQVEWGTTSGAYPSSTTKSSVLTKSHAQNLTGLTRETTYYFRVRSQDGNPSSAETVSTEQSFVTPSPETVTVTNTITVTTVSGGGGSRSLPVDSTPPVIKFIETVKVGAFETLITFVTNEPTVSFVDYGTTKEYGQLAANKVFSETHEVKLKNLRMGTNYNYRIKAIDKGGNDAFSENFTFKTPFLAEQVSNLIAVDNLDNIQSEIESAIETILPSVVPPFIEEPKVSSSTETAALITWKTNIPSYSIVSYVPDEGYDMLALNPYKLEVSQTEKKVTEHAIELTNLRSNTKYHYQVKSFSIPKAIGTSPDQTFVTKASKIEPKVVSIKKNSITVSWFTDEPASSIVEYTDLKTGATKRIIESKQDTAHSIQIENLTPDTPYRIETLGVNRKGNTVEAANDLTVRTQKDVIAPEVTSLNISNTLIPGRTDLVQTTISWKTSEPASSIIEYQEGATRTGDTLEQREEKPNLITTDHSFTITKLQPGRIYQVRALSEDEAGNIGSSPIRMIVTPRQSESIFDIVIRNFEDSFQFVRKLR